MSLTLPAPAKLNLFLHVTSRRPDGYHELQTVFQLLDHGDELRFQPTTTGLEFACSEAALDTADNLVLRAARLLQPHARRAPGCRIELVKRLPAGGGLGGGSSDAATTLVALNLLWDCGLSPEELAGLGLQLGADVPLFLYGHSAWAEGVGEKLTEIELPEDWFVVLTPACHVATGRIFADVALTRDTPAIRMPAFPFPGSKNDCESVTCMHYPQVQAVLSWLASQVPARMTGTGSSVFARMQDREQAAAILERARQERPGDCTGFVAKGLNVSPLHARLHEQLQKLQGK